MRREDGRQVVQLRLGIVDREGDLSESGCALIGETVYIREHRGAKLEAPRQMLHAAALGFAHPADGRAMRFEAPPPEDFARVLARLRGGR